MTANSTIFVSAINGDLNYLQKAFLFLLPFNAEEPNFFGVNFYLNFFKLLFFHSVWEDAG